MPVYSKFCWPFNSCAPGTNITAATKGSTNSSAQNSARETLHLPVSTGHAVTGSQLACAVTVSEGTISTLGPATPPLDLTRNTSFGGDATSDPQEKMSEGGGSAVEQEHMRLEQEATVQQHQAAIAENSTILTSPESANMDSTMTDVSVAESGPAKSLQTEAENMSIEAGHTQVLTATASQTNDDEMEVEVSVKTCSPQLTVEDDGHRVEEGMTVTSAHAAEMTSSSRLPVYEQASIDENMVAPDLVTGLAVIKDSRRSSSDTGFARHFATQFGNRDVGVGLNRNQPNENLNVLEVGHGGPFDLSTPTRPPSANRPSGMRDMAGQHAEYDSIHGQATMAQASGGLQGFSRRPSLLDLELFSPPFSHSSPGGFNLQYLRHNSGFNPIPNGTFHHSFTGMRPQSPYMMQQSHQPPPPPAFRTTFDQYTMQPPTAEYFRSSGVSSLSQLPHSFNYSDGIPMRSIEQVQFPSRKASPPVRLSTKRKADDEEEEEIDEDGDSGSNYEEPASGENGEEVTIVDPEQADDYQPSGDSDESDDSDYDSEDDQPLIDRRQQAHLKHRHRQSGTGSESSYHDEVEGDQDEDEDEEENDIVKQEHFSEEEQGENKLATPKPVRNLIVKLPLRKKITPGSSSESLSKAPAQTETQGPTENSTATPGTPIADNSLAASEPGADPDPESPDQISWKLPQYHIEVQPLKSNDGDEAPEVIVNLPGMPREILALTPDYPNQELQLLKDLFIPNQQALETPDPWPKQALLNFHTVVTMVLEAYTAYEVGDLDTKGSISLDKDEDQDLAALDASKDEIFFAVIDRWRVGLTGGALRPGYKLIRGAQEFCDIALDVIHYLEEHGFVEGPMVMRKERKNAAVKNAAKKAVLKKASAAAAKKAGASEDSPGKKRGRPKKEDGESQTKPKSKAKMVVHKPPVKKKAKTAPAPKAKKGPTLSVVKRGKDEL